MCGDKIIDVMELCAVKISSVSQDVVGHSSHSLTKGAFQCLETTVREETKQGRAISTHYTKTSTIQITKYLKSQNF